MAVNSQQASKPRLSTLRKRKKALLAKVREARALWRVNKGDKGLKKALKTAKKEFEEAKSKLISLKVQLKTNTAASNPELTSPNPPQTRKSPPPKQKSPLPNDPLSSQTPVSDTRGKKRKRERTSDQDTNPRDFAGSDGEGGKEGGGRKVFVANLSFDIDEKELKKVCSRWGTVAEVSWLENDDKKFMGCAFVTFADSKAAQRAVDAKEFKHMKRLVRVEYSRDPTQAMEMVKDEYTSCFVGNLPFDATEDGLRDWGGGDNAGIQKIYFPRDPNTGDHKGCAFIDFSNSKKLREFVLLNGKTYGGRKLRLRPKASGNSTTKSRRRRRRKKAKSHDQ
ncbi:hypothetical protein AAMO2058_000373700 [Amorphochlora amoebiformis]|uniref:RRM domain-containing protein n=1 Tax=Amorphochlora amoebiformis TaxID=1561963 RepID=A0A7S0GYB1_9EUKA|mmetsp:Transcript_19938/g.31607  ORF Transcript_19938/g.31607 Transcript_19938/m.31607 type:complete len:336 (+) Transcript_19938:19-1026(+)